MLLRLDILHPVADGLNIEMVTVRGFIDVERLRTDAPTPLTQLITRFERCEQESGGSSLTAMNECQNSSI